MDKSVIERIKRIEQWYDERRREETGITFPDEYLIPLVKQRMADAIASAEDLFWREFWQRMSPDEDSRRREAD